MQSVNLETKTTKMTLLVSNFLGNEIGNELETSAHLLCWKWKQSWKRFGNELEMQSVNFLRFPFSTPSTGNEKRETLTADTQ